MKNRQAPQAVGAFAPAMRSNPAQSQSPAVEISSTGVPLAEIAKKIMQREPGEAFLEAQERDTYVVPTKPVAWGLAILAVTCLQAGMIILESRNKSVNLAGVVTMEVETVQSAIALNLAASLFHGFEVTTKVIMVVHSIMLRMKKASMLAYCVGGCLVTAAFALVRFYLGGLPDDHILAAYSHRLGNHGPEHGWLVELASGAAAGFFYRVFAGARRV